MSEPCVFLSTSWWGGGSSLCLHYRAIAEELARRGWRVVVLVPGRVSVTAPDQNPALHDWPSPRPTRARDALFLARLIRRHRPRCLLANFGAVNVMLSVGAALRVPHRIAWYHTLTSGVDIDGRLSPARLGILRARKRLVYRLATRLIPVSQEAQRDLVGAYGVPERKCHVLYNTLARPRGGADDNGRETRTVVCVGRLDPVKGQDVLIRAIAAVPDARLRLVGTGRLDRDLRDLASRLGVEDRVEFAGSLPAEEVRAHQRRALASVVPSRSDNCPLVVIESLACGTPVVASAVGGIPEMLDEGESGLLVPPDNADALAAGLRRVLDDPDSGARLRAGARRRFERQFEASTAIPRQVDWLLGEVA